MLRTASIVAGLAQGGVVARCDAWVARYSGKACRSAVWGETGGAGAVVALGGSRVEVRSA